MSFKTSFASALTVAALTGALAMPTFAQAAAEATKASKPAASTKSVVEHAAQGSVVTMTDKTIVVRVKKTKDLTLAIRPETEKIGDIAGGKYVTVHYRDVKGENVATSIQEAPGPQTGDAAKTKSN